MGIAACCGLLVALLSLVGYEPNPRNAGAAIQPAPTSIAFVPTHPDPAIQPRAVQAGRMMAAPDVSAAVSGTTGRMIAPEGAPEPAAALLPDADACSFPCFDPSAEPTAVPADAKKPAAGSEETVVSQVDDAVQIDVETDDAPAPEGSDDASG